ncbi:MAG: hypothetical protein L3J67_00355 [Hyphomicrobiaceae bacterium]|nr:hypothetical protein [Hyphomicrobiaceae bacterium]
MNTTKPLVAAAVIAFLTSSTLIPANAQQANHHPDKAAAGKTMPGGKPGMKMGMGGMMGKGGMMGMMHKKMMGHHTGFKRAKALSTEGLKRVLDVVFP